MTDAEYQARYGWFEGDFSGVKSKERSQKFGEVFTPRWVVEKMLDAIPEDGAAEIEATVFEPACGEGAFLTCVLRRKLALARSDTQRLRACQTCYGIDIQYDNVLACREKLAGIAIDAGVDPWDARFVFARNVIHGDMIFFPMIARIFDWKTGEWTTLEEMAQNAPNLTAEGR